MESDEFKKYLIQSINDNFNENIDKYLIYYKLDMVSTNFHSIISLKNECLQNLILGYNYATICTTNHLFERLVKLTLILDHTKGLFLGDPQYDTKSRQANRMFDKTNLDINIKNLVRKGFINNTDADDLVKLKNKFRNPFSHSEYQKISKGKPDKIKGFIGDVRYIEDIIYNKDYSKGKFIETSTNNEAINPLYVERFVDGNAEQYLLKILDLWSKLDTKLKKK